MKLVKGTGYKTIVGTEGFNTAENRTWLAVKAIREGATHLFFVDDDMIYEEDTLERLLEHDKDIVGAAYANRRGDGDVVGEISESEGVLKEVSALGGGCVLIKKEVFEKLSQPWFWYEINDAGAVTMSHDWWFCKKAKEEGFEIWLDPTIRPKHIAKKEF